MKWLKRQKSNPLPVTAERCITESEFDMAVDKLLDAYVKVLSAAGNMKRSEIKKSIVARVNVLEQLSEDLFGTCEESFEEKKAC